MTQLKNQDPTSPMDTNQFTSELVQFSSVEQQINTNTSLTQLIQLTQGSEVMQASAMTGKRVTVSSDHVPLQDGKGTIQFTAPAAETVAFAIYSDTGTKLRDATMVADEGQQHLDLGRHRRFRPHTAGRQLQGRGGRRECRRHGERAAVQRDRHRDRRAEPVERRPVANGRAVGRFHQGAVGGELKSSAQRRGSYQPASAVTAPSASMPDGRPT